MNTERLLPSWFFHCGNKKLAPWVNNSDSKQHWLMQQLLKICSDCQLSRVAVQFGTKLFILFAFAQAVLPSLTAVGGGMMKNHSDRRFQNVDTLWCRRPTLWTWWRDYRSLYPLPSENYLLRSRRGPTTHNKGNLRLSPFSLTPSELNPIYIQTETSPPFSARGIHTCWYRYSLPSMLCIWPLSVSEEETEKSTLENLSWTAGCLVKHVTPWITAEPRQKIKGNKQPKNRPCSSSWLWMTDNPGIDNVTVWPCAWCGRLHVPFACVSKITLGVCGCDFVYMCIQMCSRASLVHCPPQPESLCIILRWLDKNKEQTGRGFRRSQVSHAGQWDLSARVMSPRLPVGLNFHA